MITVYFKHMITETFPGPLIFEIVETLTVSNMVVMCDNVKS